MLWTCPQCGAAVDASVARCWACKQPRPERESAPPVTQSNPVSKSGPAVAQADDTTDLVSDPDLVSESHWPSPPSTEISTAQYWTCSKCGATVDAGFLVCWSCGTSIDGVEDPSFLRADESTVVADDSQVVTFVGHEPDERIPSPDSRPCSRCQGSLEAGFIADFQRGRYVMNPSEWVAGTPQPSFWTGTWTGDRRYPIQAFRCMRCGHLEFWAGEPTGED